MNTVKKLKPKKVKGRIKVLKAMPYRGCMVYIRQIDEEIFMYDLVHQKQIYSSYLIITPKEGKKKLTKREVQHAGALIMTGAMTTIDMLKGDKINKRTKAVIDTFEANREKFEGKGAN